MKKTQIKWCIVGVLALIALFILYKLYVNRKRTLRLKMGSMFYIAQKTTERHHMQSYDQFIQYFLPNKYNYTIVPQNKKADITIWDIYSLPKMALQDDEINMLISVENADRWKYYEHYKEFGDYKNKQMNIYLYNHIDTINKQDNYIAIPTIHTYIHYYKLNQHKIQPSIYTPFHKKRFCLMINKSGLNPEIQKFRTEIEKIGIVEEISMYENIRNKSCYHAVELLNVFNQYKFIICYENSYTDGYVTEKIFNCFYARTIPIYKGSPVIKNYINGQCFIDGRQDNCLAIVDRIKDDELAYNSYVNSEKISNYYKDEEYQEELVRFIEHKLESNS